MNKYKKLLIARCFVFSMVSMVACGKKSGSDEDVTKYTDAYGNSIDAIYDGNGNKVDEFTDENGEQCALGYDKDGNLIALIYDDDGNVTGYETLKGVGSSNGADSGGRIYFDSMKKLDYGSKVLVDNDTMTFTVNEIRQDDDMGYGVKVTINNKTNGVLSVSWDNVVMNGWLCDPCWTVNVGANSQIESVVEIDSYLLGNSDIDKLTEMHFTLSACRDTNSMITSLYSGEFAIYPYGEGAVKSDVREAKDTDKLVVSDGNCSFVITECKNDSNWGYSIKVYLENKTGNDMIYDVESVSLGGKPVEPYWSCFLNTGTKTYSELFWDTEELSKAGVNAGGISEIKFKLKVYKYDESDSSGEVNYYVNQEYTVGL
ncbi:MAG: hypothetical protein ACI4E1_09300 [Lachnospira sp.]